MAGESLKNRHGFMLNLIETFKFMIIVGALWQHCKIYNICFSFAVTSTD